MWQFEQYAKKRGKKELAINKGFNAHSAHYRGRVMGLAGTVGVVLELLDSFTVPYA